MTTPGRAAPPGFEDFFRAAYRKLVACVMRLGATKDEAEDAVAASMTEVLRRWEEISDPLAYARTATRSNFIKEKTRRARLISRLIERGDVACGYQDAGLTVWEDTQWVKQTLDSLPPAQREAITGFMDEYSHVEIARLLGKDPAAVRQNFWAARKRLMLSLGGRSSHGRAIRRPREEGR
jgi:RNA polymerase sigma factor (sigma-70 family)